MEKQTNAMVAPTFPTGSTESKPRGRPLKEKGDPVADQQRARIRRAQKAFRLRKEQYVAGLEAKNRDLELIVEEMGSTFLSFSDDLLKTRKVDPEAIKATTEAFLRLSQRAAHNPGHESEERSNEFQSTTINSTSTPIETDINPFMSNAFQVGITSNTAFTPAGSTKLAPYTSPLGSEAPPTYNVVTGTDPLFNYSIWGIPTQSSPTDGTSAVPYILAGRDSFATRLYFETILLALQALRGEAPRDILHSIFRYKLRYVDVRTILAVLSGVMNVLLHGTSQDPRKSGHEKLSRFLQEEDEAVKSAIVADLRSEERSPSHYLSSWQVEEYLKSKWSLGVGSNAIRVHPLALLEAGQQSLKAVPQIGMFNYSPMFAPTSVPGGLSPEQTILNVQPLVERLSRATVTIGGGPRWHYQEVDLAVQDFLNESFANR